MKPRYLGPPLKSGFHNLIPRKYTANTTRIINAVHPSPILPCANANTNTIHIKGMTNATPTARRLVSQGWDVSLFLRPQNMDILQPLHSILVVFAMWTLHFLCKDTVF